MFAFCILFRHTWFHCAIPFVPPDYDRSCSVSTQKEWSQIRFDNLRPLLGTSHIILILACCFASERA